MQLDNRSKECCMKEVCLIDISYLLSFSVIEASSLELQDKQDCISHDL
jgi:hypothetical protein